MIHPIEEFAPAPAPVLEVVEQAAPVPVLMIAAVVCAALYMITIATKPSSKPSPRPYCRLL